MMIDIFNYKTLIISYQVDANSIQQAESLAYQLFQTNYPNQPFTHMRVRFETGEVQTTIFDDL